eukprot:1682147-Prymnesium_polylepis.1
MCERLCLHLRHADRDRCEGVGPSFIRKASIWASATASSRPFCVLIWLAGAPVILRHADGDGRERTAAALREVRAPLLQRSTGAHPVHRGTAPFASFHRRGLP